MKKKKIIIIIEVLFHLGIHSPFKEKEVQIVINQVNIIMGFTYSSI